MDILKRIKNAVTFVTAFFKYYLVKDYFLPFAASVSAWRNARVITTEATG